MEREDLVTVERLMRTWCRVNVRRNKSLMELAEETSNVRLLRMLSLYSATSELAAAAFSCDADLVRAILRRSRSAERVYFGHQSLLLGSKEFITCTRRTHTPLIGTSSASFSYQPVRPEIAPGAVTTHRTLLLSCLLIVIAEL